ncbi:MAG: chromosomal replication initiator protein DnaA, partial [Candidatus Dadabacteria bacterium]
MGGAEEINAIWKKAKEKIKKEVDSDFFSAFIDCLKLKNLDINCKKCILSAPSKLVVEHIKKRFVPEIRSAICEAVVKDSSRAKELLNGFQLELVVVKDTAHPANSLFLNSPTAQKAVIKDSASLKSSQRKKKLENEEDLYSSGNGELLLLSSTALNSSLNSHYTFSSFVVGTNNQFCHAAARQVAEQPGRAYNPLFIYGGVGLGKTHILHAIGNLVSQRYPGKRVLYLSSETFTNELIKALRYAKMNELKDLLRSIDVLLIDDVQFMCGKERTQEEFFHTFNTLYNDNKQIVLTSDKLPQDIPGIEERLQTRFSWGLTADLQAPDFETRVAILKKKSASLGYNFSKEILEFIAEKISTNVRELEGALNRLIAILSLRREKKCTLEIVRQAIKPILRTRSAVVTIDDIKEAVAVYYRISVKEMESKKRTRNVSYPRHVAMYLCRKHTTASYPEIGIYFGGRDHSSVIHAANVVSNKIK